MKTLQEIQKELDETKWRQSEIAKTDLSGKYGYCLDCPYINIDNLTCSISHNERVAISACAEAYRRSRKEFEVKPNKRGKNDKNKR